MTLRRRSKTEKALTVLKEAGKFCLAGLAYLVEGVVNTVNTGMDNANEELDRKHIDDWDKERLERELRSGGNVFRQQVIRQRLKELGEDEDDSDRQ